VVRKIGAVVRATALFACQRGFRHQRPGKLQIASLKFSAAVGRLQSATEIC
jgi:hypothetical protein